MGCAVRTDGPAPRTGEAPECSVSQNWRKRRTLHVPIWTSVVLFTLNITLLVCFIVLLFQESFGGALTTGTIAISLGLLGLIFYLFLTIKEIRLNRRQANFVDSVTHELKTPIASLRLYLETLQMRRLEPDQRNEFYGIMESEVQRLDHLIDQLLEVGRLDAIGHQLEPEDVELEPLLRRCAQTACAHHKCELDTVFTFDLQPVVVHTRHLLLDMIFGNLLDNAVKYAPDNTRVHVAAHIHAPGRIVVRISDNGIGVSSDIRNKVFRMFYRGGQELERSQKGTGLGLYIVRTLVHMLKGKVSVHDREDGPGSMFEVELPGKAVPCGS